MPDNAIRSHWRPLPWRRLLLLVAIAHSAQAQVTTWTLLSPRTSPPPLQAAAMAYDGLHDQTVLFGGFNSATTCGSSACLANATWTWDGSTWTLSNPNHRPSTRASHAMTYDAARHNIILFGGGDPSGLQADTWQWDGNDWTQLHPAHAPPARQNHQMVYDNARQQIVLFGGNTGCCLLADTWTWDGTDWTPRGSGPPARTYFGMAYDTNRNETVLFGGNGNNTRLADTWTWDGATWTQRYPPNSPPARTHHVMAHHAALQQTILFGGNLSGGLTNDTWAWTGGDWYQIQPSIVSGPSQRFYEAITYDSKRHVVLMYSGAFAPADTWTFSAPVTPRTFLVSFTGWGNQPPTCVLPILGSGCWQYPQGYVADSLGIVNSIADAERLLLNVNAAAFTFYSRTNGSAGFSPLFSDDHLEAQQWLESTGFTNNDRLLIAGHSYGGHRAWLFADQIRRAFPGAAVDALVLVDPIDWFQCNDLSFLAALLGTLGPCSQSTVAKPVPTAVRQAYVFRQSVSYGLNGYTLQSGATPVQSSNLAYPHTEIDDSEVVRRSVMNLVQPGTVSVPGMTLRITGIVVTNSPLKGIQFAIAIQNTGRLVASNIVFTTAALGGTSPTFSSYPVILPGDTGTAILRYDPAGLPIGVPLILRLQGRYNPQTNGLSFGGDYRVIL